LRREITLGLANKEGGAHVDADISAKYKRLLASDFVRLTIDGKDMPPLKMENGTIDSWKLRKRPTRFYR